jgi:signal transduction histidine kinase
MSNSIKHTPIDRDPVIEIHAHLSSPYVELQISDQGKGIDLANFGDRLFKMYSPIGRNEGKGLGLFITKNQVEAMGGTIEVKSKLNKGTTVKIRLIEDGSNFSKNLAK